MLKRHFVHVVVQLVVKRVGQRVEVDGLRDDAGRWRSVFRPVDPAEKRVPANLVGVTVTQTHIAWAEKA